MGRSLEPVFLYQFDMRLVGFDAPMGFGAPIWRRFLVPDHLTLSKLHHVLQVVMGWEHAHAYEFLINDTPT